MHSGLQCTGMLVHRWDIAEGEVGGKVTPDPWGEDWAKIGVKGDAVGSGYLSVYLKPGCGPSIFDWWGGSLLAQLV